MLGYSQYSNLPIIQIADITGAYGISFLIVMGNLVIYSWCRRAKSKPPVLIFIILLTLSLLYGFNQLKQPTLGAGIKISVIQGNIPQEEKWGEEFKQSILKKYIVLTKQASLDNPQLIIWPETSVPGYLLQEQWLYSAITSLAQEAKTALLVGAPVADKNSDKSFNSAILISPEGKLLQVHHKLHLVPFGEFVPGEKFLRFIRNSIVIGDFIPGDEYSLFSLNKVSTRQEKLNSQLKFGVLVCFEDIFPDLVRKFVRQGADFMVNITNDAWFKKSAAPYQHLQASVFRAVENRINIVRSANTGYSGFIDPKGRIVKRVHAQRQEIEISGFATQRLNIFPTTTFYTRFGDIFAVFCAFLTLVFILRMLFLYAMRGKTR